MKITRTSSTKQVPIMSSTIDKYCKKFDTKESWEAFLQSNETISFDSHDDLISFVALMTERYGVANG